MPDYDVGITGLVQPPATAPVQTYYPTVSVHNYGVHPAAVTGLLRIYDKATGVQLSAHSLATTEDIPAGATRNVASADPWAPTEADIGRQFLFIADVTTYRDQYELNNHLGPVTVTVTAVAPPPLPPVTLHASQHEAGGADELNLEALAGKTAERQEPLPHKDLHEHGGGDEPDVTGLEGKLADPQTPEAHHTRHEPGGDDPISGVPPGAHHTKHEDGGTDKVNLANLSGECKDMQNPLIHGAAKHDASVETPEGAQAKVNAHSVKATDVHGVGDSTVESATGAQAKVNAHSDLHTGVHGVAESEVESVAGAVEKVLLHRAETTEIHGVGASTVESAAGAQAKVDAHKDLSTGVHGVGESTVESAAGAQAKVDAHKDLSTGVHGVGAGTVETTSHKNQPGGYCPLDGAQEVPIANAPDRTVFERSFDETPATGAVEVQDVMRQITLQVSSATINTLMVEAEGYIGPMQPDDNTWVGIKCRIGAAFGPELMVGCPPKPTGANPYYIPFAVKFSTYVTPTPMLCQAIITNHLAEPVTWVCNSFRVYQVKREAL